MLEKRLFINYWNSFHQLEVIQLERSPFLAVNCVRFPVILLMRPYKEVLTFEFVNEILGRQMKAPD